MKVAHKVKLIREPEYSEVDFQLQTPCFLRSQHDCEQCSDSDCIPWRVQSAASGVSTVTLIDSVGIIKVQVARGFITTLRRHHS